MSKTNLESFDDSFGVVPSPMTQPEASQQLGWASPTLSDFTEVYHGAARGLHSAPGSTLEDLQAGLSQEPPAVEYARLKARLLVLEASMAVETPPKQVQTPSLRKRTASRGGYTEASPSKRACPATPTPSRIAQDATVRGPIEAMWSPGVTPEQRRTMYDQMKISSPAATNNISPPPKRKAAPKKPRAPAQKKTAAPKKAPKKQNQQASFNFEGIDLTTTDASAFANPHESVKNQRPVSELYQQKFMSLPLSDKARLLLPLLRGIDPATGQKFDEPGSLSRHTITTPPIEPNTNGPTATMAFDDYFAALPTTPTIVRTHAQPQIDNIQAINDTGLDKPITMVPVDESQLLNFDDLPTDLAWWNAPLSPLEGSFPNDLFSEDLTTATTTATTTTTTSDLDAELQIALNGAATIDSPDSGAKRQREALEEHERRIAEGRRR